MEQSNSVDINDLPENCISNILSLTTPRDACRSSAISPIFRSAANSDSVWERFLPSDYQQILSSSVSPSSPLVFSSKKELYLHLCDNPIIIDNGTKSFALEKCSGKKCYMIAAKELGIVWGDTPIYWIWRPLPESRFSEVAELLKVCWLEIHGKMETRLLSPNTTYEAYLVLNFTDRAKGLGFRPAEVSVKLANGGDVIKRVYLKPMISLGRIPMLIGHFRQMPPEAPEEEDEVPKNREDGWMEIEMGEFFNERGEDGEVEMILMEVKGGNWKSGLIIQGIELRPKKNSY